MFFVDFFVFLSILAVFVIILLFFWGCLTKKREKREEGERERIQIFEGVCISRSGEGINQNFTVRKISYGEGVERVFTLYSPLVDSIKLIRKGKVRRSKLYYLRTRRGKSARIAERQDLQSKKLDNIDLEDQTSEAEMSEEKSAKEK